MIPDMLKHGSHLGKGWMTFVLLAIVEVLAPADTGVARRKAKFLACGSRRRGSPESRKGEPHHSTDLGTYPKDPALPCTEGVRWFVLKTPVDISPEEIDTFARLYPHDVRPLQRLNGRVVKESR
jgi:hypothetical protein